MTDEISEKSRFGRRHYLKAAGTALGASLLSTTTAAAEPRTMNTITIIGNNGKTGYNIEVDGEIVATTHLTGEDDVKPDKASAVGAVRAGRDKYWYDGELSTVDVQGDGTVAFGRSEPPNPSSDPSPEPSEPTFGAYFGTPVDGGDPSAEYEDWIGRDVQYGEGFIHRDEKYDLPSWFADPWSEWVNELPGRRMNFDTHIGEFTTLEAAANGSVDDNYRRLGEALVDNDMPNSSVRIICEYDLDFTVHPQTDREKDWFKQFWRRAADILHNTDGGDFTTVLSPNNDIFETDGYIESTYPGDEYVDMIGVSTYDQDWGVYQPDHTPTHDEHIESWETKTGPFLDEIKAFADDHGKPFCIPEWGVVAHDTGHGGGDNPYYIQQMYDWMQNNDTEWHVYFESPDKHGLSPPDTQFLEASAKFKKLFG